MSEHKQGNHHNRSSVRELRGMSDKQLVEEVASEDETQRLQSEAELQRRLAHRIARLNRTLVFVAGLMFLMDLVLIGLAYVWLRPRVDMGEAWKRASDLDLQDVRRRAGGVVTGAGDVVLSAREVAGQSLQAAAPVVEAAGQRLIGAEKLAERSIERAGKRMATLR
jgi:hypothetical protein